MMNKADTSPCMYCTVETGRTGVCHSTCERFLKAKAIKDEEKRIHNEARKKSYIMYEYKNTVARQRKFAKG